MEWRERERERERDFYQHNLSLSLINSSSTRSLLNIFSLRISHPVEGKNPFQLKDSNLAQREPTASPKSPKPVDRILGFYILL